MEYLTVASQALLTAVFGWAAVTKLRAFATFRRSVRTLGLVPDRYAGVAAAGIVAIESGCALAVPLSAVVGLIGCLCLLTIFCVGILVLLMRGVTASCACFGATGAPLGRKHLTRNGLLAAIALTGLVPTANAAGAGAGAGDLQPAGVLTAVFAGLIGAALLVAFDDLVELFTPSTAR
ncbi:methylamine utilization protein MauE [Kribbella voronezhensis]|uniref:Methylamine utilization protein MauE n=1 Tax=Kribbella voronezhensis TaxID=2512212 RepID=A0A4R7SZK1_9ACTN|nr:MauE/DoxX family redox-associated membrane protein [Kribbella voronezhensis]TDU83987.1 methylamine utilization protein MauE [Kribbella voronezhensis]